MEVKFDFAYGAMTMFGYYKFRDVSLFIIIIILFIVIWAMQEHHEVSILLNLAGFAQIRKHRAWIIAPCDAT